MPLDNGSEKVMLKWTVGVYGVFGGSGRGPCIETTSLVEGEEVSIYADPGALVTRLVRRTAISKNQNQETQIFRGSSGPRSRLTATGAPVS